MRRHPDTCAGPGDCATCDGILDARGLDLGNSGGGRLAQVLARVTDGGLCPGQWPGSEHAHRCTLHILDVTDPPELGGATHTQAHPQPLCVCECGAAADLNRAYWAARFGDAERYKALRLL